MRRVPESRTPYRLRSVAPSLADSMAALPLRMIHLGLGAMDGILAEWASDFFRVPGRVDVIMFSGNRHPRVPGIVMLRLYVGRSFPGFVLRVFGSHLALHNRRFARHRAPDFWIATVVHASGQR